MAQEGSAPGWDAIDAAVAPLVADTKPMHWATGTGLPNQGGVWGVSAYAQPGYWFFVTYGLSELFAKVTDEPTVSGFGEELTMRISRPEAESDAPEWTARLLARLGELVYERRTPFLPGGRLEITDASDAVPPALAWTEDPELDSITTPFGAVQFVATVGVSSERVEAMRQTSTQSVIDHIRSENPLLITPPGGI